MRQSKPSDKYKHREREYGYAYEDEYGESEQSRQSNQINSSNPINLDNPSKLYKQRRNNAEHKNPSNSFRIGWVVILLIYLYLLTKLILFKGGAVDVGLVWDRLTALLHQPDLIHTRTVNLTPFQEIKRDWHSLSLHRPGTAIHLAGNIVAFIPFGILVAGMVRVSVFTGLNVLFLSFLLSLGYEATQLLTGIGIFDVDDLMLNTLGGMIGYLVYTVLLLSYRLLTGGKARVAAKRYGKERHV
ncbi:VanZ family protein [Paenibacillus silvae]|jgi:glycopeptide antibiotics resistance protein|uniref:VanZ family protein n=1 Tax=Paenibacillus silvae TaxID=1325358 RepID=UPI003CEF8892